MHEITIKHWHGHGAINCEAQQVCLAAMRVHGRLCAEMITCERGYTPLACARYEHDDFELRETAGAHHDHLPIAQQLHVIGVLALLISAEKEPAVGAVGDIKHGEFGLFVVAGPLAAESHCEKVVAEPLHLVRPIVKA